MSESIQIVDTHTGGEPTRIVVEAPIDLGEGTLRQRRHVFRQRFDHYRRAIVCEPRGSEVMVGALLTESERESSRAGVIFFNNVGFLGMCGHGMMGVAVALAHLGEIGPGTYQIDTPVGTVELSLVDQHRVSLKNVPSYRYRKEVPIELPDRRVLHGDVAWGGNWFYICHDHRVSIEPACLQELTLVAQQVRRQLDTKSITGANGEPIDHVEFIGPPRDIAQADAVSFVLCPGGVYDRSPCGTGTSAKVACLAADGKLAPGEIYRQQSIVGSLFEASYEPLPGDQVLPRITGQAFVNGEGRLLIDEADPFALGFA